MPQHDDDGDKDSCDFAPRVLGLRTAPKNSPTVVRGASSAETIQKPPRHNLDDDDASSCSEWGEESAFNELPEFCGETSSCALYLAAQLAVLMRDGQGLPGVRLRGLTSLVLCPVLGFI